ncbi:hypothetical protein KP509_02G007100 [Ceratopteris richardii]|uniref:50S ribosomal protein L18 n=1 Tax=Ceratopteris richardii TaxID=49495 RepID=A0A8T2VB95_CERRI|nr:hypothetical protein KP509_02G007100 [Ceratopteris richardii]
MSRQIAKREWTTIHNRTSDYLKLYVLKVFFSNKYVTAQVFHTPTKTVAAAASSQEKALREKMETHSDCAAAGKIGEILANRLKEKEIPAIHFYYTKEQRYHGKLKALIDNIREHGISFVG